MTSARLGLFAAMATVVPCAVGAQSESATIVLEHPASARALALGDAMVAVPDADGSVFTNPALLDAAHGPAASMSGQRYIANASLAAASGSFGLLGGTLGAGVRGLDYGSVAEYVPDTANFGGQRGIATGRDVSASELAVTAGYARTARRLHMGTGVGYVRQQIADVSAGTFMLDLGVATDVSHGIVLGAAVQHMGGNLRLGTTSSPLPRLARIGASVPVHRGPMGALVSVEGAIRQNGDVVPHAGGEIWWRTANGVTLTGRGGVRGGSSHEEISRYTAGVGLGSGHVALDYAYEGMGALGGAAHRVGVRFRR